VGEGEGEGVGVTVLVAVPLDPQPCTGRSERRSRAEKAGVEEVPRKVIKVSPEMKTRAYSRCRAACGYTS
jgi:hypothetical protein